MNREDIIRVAQEAGFDPHDMSDDFTCNLMDIERFANLLEAAVLERIKWDGIHTCHPHCDRPACVAVRRAREDEREACAALCDKISDEDGFEGGYADRCAFAIRERGAP